MIGLFCRTLSLLQGSFAKETYDFNFLFCRTLSLLQGSFAKETKNFMGRLTLFFFRCRLALGMCCGVATISRLLKIIGVFCKRALQKRRYSAKATYNFMEPTNRAHPITGMCFQCATDNCVFSVLATRNVLSMRQQQGMCFQSATGNVLGEARCYKECASQKKACAIKQLLGPILFFASLYCGYLIETLCPSLKLARVYLPFSCVLSMSPSLARCMNMQFSTVYPT